ncbi:hypothetical protein B0H10DRAFT_2229532 [Mycena sp. CBHHK59/15]|nr:hypothetical protein B0H10DRAFT_2229532 [Mycena sp. CBHHK59/15]
MGPTPSAEHAGRATHLQGLWDASSVSQKHQWPNNPSPKHISLQKPAPKAAHLVPKQRPPVPDLQKGEHDLNIDYQVSRALHASHRDTSHLPEDVPDDPVMLKLTREIHADIK